MKTKILLATILLLTLFSCKSDDEGSGTPTIPADEKYLSKVTNDEGVQKTAIVYHLQRIKVSIAQRLKVNHLQRVKVNH